MSSKSFAVLLAASVGFAAVSFAQDVPPLPGWAQAMPPGPDTSVKITEAYARLVARDAYFWSWPQVNVYNRRQAVKDLQDFIKAGPVPSAPLSELAMLTDYISPEQRLVACPNQDTAAILLTAACFVSPVTPLQQRVEKKRASPQGW